MNRSRLVFLIVSALFVLPMLVTLVVVADPGRGADPSDAVVRREARIARHAHGSADAKDAKDAKEPKEPDTFDSYVKYLKVFSEVFGLIRDTYVDEPKTDALMAGALEGVTDAMDPFTVYVPASAVAGYQKALAAGKRLSGLSLLKERGATLVMAVEKGSPADGAGLKVGDLVSKLNDTSTRNLPLYQMQEQLVAAPGTKIGMEIIRIGAPVQVTFELKAFVPPAVSVTEVADAALVPLAPANKAAQAGKTAAKPTAAPPASAPLPAGTKTATVLRIPSFTADTAAQVREALAAPGRAGRGKLIVDLRGVSSGDADVAYDVAKLFATGDLGALMQRKQELRGFTSNAAPAWTGRLLVLVDRGTAGPAEILSSVLRQRAGAELLGEHTLGYAGHQGTADLSTGSRLYFTDAFYTGPDKRPLNEALKPDVAVTERNRTFPEKDLPMSDLILRRGVHHLLEEPSEVAKKAA
jgi:carboxyl-terminal processing protease